MENRILGLHHITAIADDAQHNYSFYTKVLGLRLVKKTVNFDDPGTYHFYYGDEAGSPGTILTFFPWEGIGQGIQVQEWQQILVILCRKKVSNSGVNVLNSLT